MICKELADYLRFLADKYENESFFDGDPSFSLKKYTSVADTECAAFIAAVLAFGRRDQFLKKIEYIYSLAEKYGSLSGWLKDKAYKTSFIPAGCSPSQKFYRFYSYTDIIVLFDKLSLILQTNESLGDFFKQCYEQQKATDPRIHLSQVVCSYFEECRIVPSGKNCANKRINMFLRWTELHPKANYFFSVETEGNAVLEFFYRLIPVSFLYVLLCLLILVPYMVLVTAGFAVADRIREKTAEKSVP